MGLLDDRTAVVTGGARGIGLAIAARLNQEGAAVVLADLDEAQAARAATALSGRAVGVGCDVTDPEQVQSLVGRALAEFGALDVRHL